MGGQLPTTGGHHLGDPGQGGHGRFHYPVLGTALGAQKHLDGSVAYDGQPGIADHGPLHHQPVRGCPHDRHCERGGQLGFGVSRVGIGRPGQALSRLDQVPGAAPQQALPVDGAGRDAAAHQELRGVPARGCGTHVRLRRGRDTVSDGDHEQGALLVPDDAHLVLTRGAEQPVGITPHARGAHADRGAVPAVDHAVRPVGERSGEGPDGGAHVGVSARALGRASEHDPAQVRSAQVAHGAGTRLNR